MTALTRVLVVAAQQDSDASVVPHIAYVDNDMTVRWATDGAEARECLASDGTIDCIVAAGQLPDTDGSALCETLRQQDVDIPFLLLLNEHTDERVSEALAAGVTDCVQPTSDRDDGELLIHRIRRTVASHQATTQHSLAARFPAPFVSLSVPALSEIRASLHQRLSIPGPFRHPSAAGSTDQSMAKLFAGRSWSLPSKQADRTPLYWLFGIVLVGALVRLYGLTDVSLWVDEIYAITTRSSLPLWQVVTANELHPPLYYMLLKYWMELFGRSAGATRLLSVLFGVIAIILIYFLGTALFGRTAGILAAVLLALSPFHIHTSQTVRMYELLTLLTIGSFYAFVRVLQTDTARVKYGYLVSTWLLLLTHLFGGFVVLAENLAYLIAAYSSSEPQHLPSRKTWLGLQGILALLYSPVVLQLAPRLYTVLSDAGTTNIGWLHQPDLGLVWQTFLAFAGKPLQYPIVAGGPLVQTTTRLILGIGAIAAIGFVITTHNDDQWLSWDRRQDLQMAFVFVLLASTMALPYVLSFLLTPMYTVRYMAPASVGFLLVVAAGLASFRSKPLQVGLVVIVVVCSGALVGVYHTTPTREDWEGAVAYIDDGTTADDLIVLQPHWIRATVSYYGVRPSATVVNYTAETPRITAADIHRFNSRKQHYQTVWLINRAPAPVDSLLDALNQTHRLVAQRSFGVITVYKYSHDDESMDSNREQSPRRTALRQLPLADKSQNH
jgi:mannosyltransferase